MAHKLSALLKLASTVGDAIDGREETATALAASVERMVLDAGTRIAWDKPLRSARIGLRKAEDIQRFKANLSRLLPAQAAAWIEAAPISIHNTLGAVAELVAAAKLTASRLEPLTYGIPAIVVKGAVEEARTRVANVLGRDFADKASDRFVYRAALRMKASPTSDVATEPVALVFEFKEGAEPPPEPAMIAARETGGSEVAAMIDAALRGKSIEAFRNLFYARITGIRAEIEKKLTPVVAARESGEELPQTTEVCWLNGTMRLMGQPRDMADFAGERSLERIGLPRLLEREMDVSVGAIGVLAFRLANAYDGTGIQVAVIDGECDANHPAMTGRIVHKSNFTKEAWGAPDPHATTIGGILCSANGTLGGICPAATILNYKVFTTNAGLQGTDFAATLAIQGALEDGARVANLSWGLGLGTSGDSREARAVNRAWRLGLVLVKSAGNKGPTLGTLTSPADAKDVIVVGASDRRGTTLTEYSSRGPNGAHAGPDLIAPGASNADPLHGLLPGSATGNAGWGTSLAAPHVAGLAALLLHQNPALKPDDVRALLATKCSLLGSAVAAGQGLGFVKL